LAYFHHYALFFCVFISASVWFILVFFQAHLVYFRVSEVATLVLSAMLANNFSTTTCFATFELIKFTCFGSTLSYPYNDFLNPRPPRTRSKFKPHPHAQQCGLNRPAQDSSLHAADDNAFANIHE